MLPDQECVNCFVPFLGRRDQRRDDASLTCEWACLRVLRARSQLELLEPRTRMHNLIDD